VTLIPRATIFFTLLTVAPTMAQAAAPAEVDAARARLVGIWDATPALDIDFLEATAKDQLPFLRANALGTRVSYRFKSDGSFTSIVLKRNGREDGVNVDRLGSARGAGKWSVVDVHGQNAKVQLTPEGGKPMDRSLKFTSDDGFDMELPELEGKGFQSSTPFRRNLGERTLRWIQANNTAAPRAPLVRDMAQFVASAMKRREDFALRFGKDLMKSGKATEVSGFCEQFYVLEFSDKQAKQLGLTGTQVSALHARRDETFPVLSPAKVIDVKMVEPGPIDLGKPITATVTIAPDRVVQISPDGGDCSVRCSIEAGEKSISLFSNFIAPVMLEMQVNVKVTPPAKYASYEGPVILYFDLCREIKFEGGHSAIEVLSNSRQVLLDAKPTKKSS
jgi:hypothetical protein